MGAPKAIQYSRHHLMSAEFWGINASLHLLAIALSIITDDAVGHQCYQGMLVAPVQPAVHQVLQALLHRTAPPTLRPELVVLQGALPSPAQGLIFVPVVFHKVLSAPSSSLPGYLWMAVLSLSIASGPHNLVTAADLVKLLSFISSKSLLKILKSSGPSRDPGCAPLVTSLKAKPDSLTSILRLSSFYPYFHPSSFLPTWLSPGDNLQIFIM